MLVAVAAGLCLLTGAAPVAVAEPAPVSTADIAPAAEQMLTWTADDSMTEYASAPATATAGPATIVFANSTTTGNTTGMTHTLTFDTTTPGYNHDVDVNITASPLDAEQGLHQVQTTLTPGKYRYYCAMPGHTMSGELVVTEGGVQDTTPPEVSATVDGNTDGDGNYIGTATVTLAATDDSSGVDTVEYTLDDDTYRTYSQPVTINTPGAHTLHFRATDKAGNTSDPKTLVVNVVQPSADTTPPQVTPTVDGERNDAGHYVGSATVTLAATDTDSGVAAIEYTMDGGAYTPYSQPIVVSQAGTHTLTYRATDKAGNTSDPQALTVTVDPLGDVVAPYVTASLDGEVNSEGAYVGKATLTLAATDNDSGVASIEYDLDGVGYTRYGQPPTITSPGTHMLHYRATDRAGNTSEVQMLSFAIAAAGDHTAPVVTAQLTGEQNWSWDYVGRVTVTLSATDEESGVARIEYSVDGAAFTRYRKPFVIDQIGTHTIRYRATDQAGNTSETGSVTCTVVAGTGDKSKPKRPPNPSSGHGA
ncbi:OmpL47-type beta-barrel domain-containing protein [Saccharopolyspora sp. NPDC002376]